MSRNIRKESDIVPLDFPRHLIKMVGKKRKTPKTKTLKSENEDISNAPRHESEDLKIRKGTYINPSIKQG